MEPYLLEATTFKAFLDINTLLEIGIWFGGIKSLMVYGFGGKSHKSESNPRMNNFNDW